MYRSVLCLFDSEAAVEKLRETLGPGCRVLAVSTVFGALQELRKFTPDMVVVQVGLRDESCFDFFRAAQPTLAAKKTPMIAVCVGDIFHESIEAFIQKTCVFFGCQNYLTYKDFQSDALRFQLTKSMRSICISKAC